MLSETIFGVKRIFLMWVISPFEPFSNLTYDLHDEISIKNAKIMLKNNEEEETIWLVALEPIINKVKFKECSAK